MSGDAVTASCGRQGQVDRHFAGRLTVHGEQNLRSHLPHCPSCQTRYGRHLRLARLDPRALGLEERLRRGLGLRRPAVASPGWFVAGGVLALGLLLLVPGLPGRHFSGTPDPMAGVRARGSGLAAAPLVLALDEQGTEVSAFRTSGPGAPAPASDRIGRDDELAFAYRNGAGWSRLMVFARDEQGVVYWFYPQWLDPALDPVGVELATSPDLQELPAAVSHDFAGRRLLLCALASRQALSTRQVEQALAADPQRSPAQLFKGADQAVACRPVEVVR